MSDHKTTPASNTAPSTSPFTNSTASTSSPHVARELRTLEYWDVNKIFERSVADRPISSSFTYYDGPPFATGLPHYGHLVGSIMKDLVPRYQTMLGHRVERRWGWDCHGLPIENLIEKKFNLTSKEDIEQFGIKSFNEACEETVLAYATEWQHTIHRLGRWVDMKNAYKTMDLDYMESVWSIFKTLYDKGLIYEGYKSMLLCPRCATTLSNFEATQNYQEVKDLSVFVRLPLLSGEWENANLIVWTTTPWTLPGNVLVAVNPALNYHLLEVQGETGPEKIILGASAHSRLLGDGSFAKLFGISTPPTILKEFLGAELVGQKYTPCFSSYANHPDAFKVVGAQFVAENEGTGLVHIAPAFGEDDTELGKTLGVPPIFHVSESGHFAPEVVHELTQFAAINGREKEFTAAANPVKSKGDSQSVDVLIIKFLAGTGKLFGKLSLLHSYPLCWRCDTPLINYATNSWFVSVTTLKADLLKNNQSINWVPDNMKAGRFGKWLEGARDWAISRSRYWGTPLPIWKAEDGTILCLGSVAELEALSGQSITNLHKQVVDELKFTKDGKTYHRIPEVLDCWFESGSMPYAQNHYLFTDPATDPAEYSKTFPADFVSEGQDQTRGWFYTLHVLATALFGTPAFKNVIVNGIVLAEDGKKMSKRLQNYPDPDLMLQTYGADAVRFYLMSTPVVTAENLRFQEAGVSEVVKKLLNILSNVLEFYKLYSALEAQPRVEITHILDKWIESRTAETVGLVTTGLDNYTLDAPTRALQNFVTDLSTWYLRGSRDRFKGHQLEARPALQTLGDSLLILSQLIAPYTPFIAEEIYRTVQTARGLFMVGDSVHLTNWPIATNVNADALAIMGVVRSLASRALEAREKFGRPIKQRLGELKVFLPADRVNILTADHLQVLMDEVNVEKITVLVGEGLSGGELAVELDPTLTPALLRHGLARELIRRINGWRKEVGLTISDRIGWELYSEAEAVKATWQEFKSDLENSTLAHEVKWGSASADSGVNTIRFLFQEDQITVVIHESQI